MGQKALLRYFQRIGIVEKILFIVPMKIKILLLLLFLGASSAFARVSVALFPLYNKSAEPRYDWIGSAVPEVFFRKMSEFSDIQVWDPVFLFSVDSLGWQLHSDSLLAIHRNRWGWNVVIGGFYTVVSDSVCISLCVRSFTDTGSAVSQIRIEDLVISHIQNCSRLLFKTLPLLQHTISSEDSIKVRSLITADCDVYAAYAAGYGYEMQGLLNHAISAYSTVIDLDDSFILALFRLGKIYSRARKKEYAWKYLSKATSQVSHSSLVIAEIAEYMVYNDQPVKALAYIESHRNVLEKTTHGMKIIGMAYILMGEYQRAVSILTRAVASGPSNLETDFILGKAYLLLGQFANAAEIFTRLTKYQPLHVRYYSFLGEAYREAGKLMESCQILESAMRIDPDNVPNLLNLSHTYFALKWYKKAEQLLIRAKERAPEMAEIYVNLGVLYWHMDREQEAKSIFDQLQTKKMCMQSVLNNQANMLFLGGQTQQAIKRYKEADKHGKKSETVLYNLAQACFSVGNIKDAALYLDELLLLSPERLDVLKQRAHIALIRGRQDNAEHYYRKILDLSPHHKETLRHLIAVLEQQQRYKDAIEITEKYLTDFPQDQELRLIVPDLYRKMGWYEVAYQEFQNLSNEKEYRENAFLYLGMAKCMYNMIQFKDRRNYESTIYAFKKAAQLDPVNPEPFVIIGEIYLFYLYNKQRAIEYWQEALNVTVDPGEKSKLQKRIEEAQNK